MRARRVICIAVICYAVFCAMLAIFLGELAFRSQRVPINERQSAEATAARFGAALRDVSVIASDGSQLQGWLARPADANGDAVILLHGVGDNRQGMMGFAELFLSNGFTVLVPDSRAQGESGGDFPTYGLKESYDVHRWFDWLVMQQHPKCIFGMGESMGAAVLLQSIEKENRFCAVVAESSFASFRQIAFVRVGQFFHTGTWLGKVALRPAVELAFLYGKLTRGINLADASPERSVVGSRVPILLIHGLADDNIPFQQSERIRAHDPVDIVLWEVPFAGHCGAVNAAGQEFNTRVLGWFTSHDGGYAQRSTPQIESAHFLETSAKTYNVLTSRCPVMAIPNDDPRTTPPSVDPQVRIGHVHLKVADLQRALRFYSGILGFEVTQRYGDGAVFLSAGGYHHHVALNTWESLGGGPPLSGTTGLYHTAILYPNRAALAAALRRVLAAKIPLEGAADHGVSESIYLRDPDDNGVELYCDKPREVWPRTPDGQLAMFTRRLDLHELLSEAPGGTEVDAGPRDL